VPKSKDHSRAQGVCSPLLDGVGAPEPSCSGCRGRGHWAGEEIEGLACHFFGARWWLRKVVNAGRPAAHVCRRCLAHVTLPMVFRARALVPSPWRFQTRHAGRKRC